jgi:hypothetical protein
MLHTRYIHKCLPTYLQIMVTWGIELLMSMILSNRFVSLPAFLYLSLCLYLFLSLSIYLSLYLSTYLSIISFPFSLFFSCPPPPRKITLEFFSRNSMNFRWWDFILKNSSDFFVFLSAYRVLGRSVEIAICLFFRSKWWLNEQWWHRSKGSETGEEKVYNIDLSFFSIKLVMPEIVGTILNNL